MGILVPFSPSLLPDLPLYREISCYSGATTEAWLPLQREGLEKILDLVYLAFTCCLINHPSVES